MPKIINLYKQVGLSPLEAINLFKEGNIEYKDIKMTYAGRLDPIADGVLLVLAGEAVFEKDKYLKLDKEYEAEILFGFLTDTYDLLGIPTQVKENIISLEKIEIALKEFVGEFSFSLPSYSSYKVKGKPLFQWAREGKLDEIEEVKRTTKIYDIEFAKVRPSQEINSKDLLEKITGKIDLVKGDFRQDQIKNEWKKVLEKSDNKNKKYLTIKIKVNCSSGTYIRSLANELGKKLNTSAIVLGLRRTKAGEFEIKDSIRL